MAKRIPEPQRASHTQLRGVKIDKILLYVHQWNIAIRDIHGSRSRTPMYFGQQLRYCEARSRCVGTSVGKREPLRYIIRMVSPWPKSQKKQLHTSSSAKETYLAGFWGRGGALSEYLDLYSECLDFISFAPAIIPHEELFFSSEPTPHSL